MAALESATSFSSCCGDHRIAMAFAIAGLRATGSITVKNCANVATSFPNFVELSRKSGIDISASGIE